MFTPPEDLLCNTGPTWHGAAIMWHNSINHFVTPLKSTNTRFTCIKVKSDYEAFLAVSVYFPTCGKDTEYLECVSELINFVTENKNEDETVLIGTDSNCSEKSSPRRLLAFHHLCQELNLSKVASSGPTFHHHNGSSESNIDYFLISAASSSSISNASTVCSRDNPENLSSHDPVIASLHIPERGYDPDINYSHTYTDFTHQRIVWDSSRLPIYQSLSASALAEYEEEFKDPEYTPLKCELFSRILVRSAELCLDSIPALKLRKDKKHPAAVHQAWIKLRKSYRTWKTRGKKKDLNCVHYMVFRKARSDFQRTYRRNKELKYIRENNLIMGANAENKNELFKLIRNIRSSKCSQAPTILNTPLGTYKGQNTLEGFAADAELLGQPVGEENNFDNYFYKLCKMDNCYIFEFKGNDSVKIPEMRIEDLLSILNKEMKLKKACDIYKLTTEHLRYAGPDALSIILRLLNSIINNIYYLTCPQVKIGLSTMVYKGKKKPKSEANSWRRITVTPQLGSIIDRYIDPMGEFIFRKVQSQGQLGFTENVSYLLAALERGECQRYALDTKRTCFGVTFDGQAAFPSVDRDILIRELHSCGETGDLLNYSKNTYQNTVSHLKQDGKLSRQFREFKGSRQGHKKASGHFKSYINPCITTANSSELGFWIGPICVSCVCVADDTLVLSDDARKLQGLINIVGHYGKRYRLTFGPAKTKVTVTGSRQDMSYYQDIGIWSLYGKKLEVTENNDHLGLIVSGTDEELKNVDKCIDSARKILFSLLGNIFSYKCKLSPSVLHHVWTLYVSPILRSGLSALPIRPPIAKVMTSFHHKILRGILKLSPWSPVAPLYFLLGELPVEAVLHMDLLTLFWNVWANPQTKIHEITKYLLMVTGSNSHTWAAHLRVLFQLYLLPDPLTLMSSPLWSKSRWKMMIKSAIISHHESSLRKAAEGNYKLLFFNVQTIGLTGRNHPVLSGVTKTQEVVRSRVHIKMLVGDYPCAANIGKDRAQDVSCTLCKAVSPCVPAPAEDMIHILTMCRATADTRSRVLPDLLNTIASHFPNNTILEYPTHTHLTQFILDPTSLNLPMSIRINPAHHALSQVLTVCRNVCYAIHNDRTRQLKDSHKT